MDNNLDTKMMDTIHKRKENMMINAEIERRLAMIMQTVYSQVDEFDDNKIYY